MANCHQTTFIETVRRPPMGTLLRARRTAPRRPRRSCRTGTRATRTAQGLASEHDAGARLRVGLSTRLRRRDRGFADLYGAFPVKRLFWVVLTVFCSERERPFFVPSP